MAADERIEQAELLYERAVFGGDPAAPDAADRVLDALEADLQLARGRVVHARFLADRVVDARELELFEHAARLYERLGDTRGLGEALFWTGTFHQVVCGDTEAALPALRRSLELARQAGDRLTASYALRHLGIADHMAGRLDTARTHLEESTRLRRELEFLPGVAANLIGLAYLAAQQERRDDASALLGEAAELAAKTASQGILRQAEEARAELRLS
ncbi:tetratricopeptide repeat protein [Streptacidiphilus griseoplanus]|uniref:tetratricopeptide repeat protein n=1 Tax=Peterkaempfera griseoplana TaxID=66896 RepID=UPI0006E24024|nr:tetratricopeptide repeat protein [Peterkaempfera griseoplana]